MKYLFGIALLVFIAGVPGINFFHHLELPTVNKNRITNQYIVTYQFPNIIGTRTDIRLETEITSPEHYSDVNKVLQEAKKGDVVVFHLVGIGGQVDSTMSMISNIKSTKAHVIMEVEAPVYSAHAYLAISGNTLVMHKYTFLMFHTTTLVNVDCDKMTGTDRGVSNVWHCQTEKDASMRLFQEFLMSLPILTAQHKLFIMAGYDVYIFPEDLNRPK